MRRLTKTAFELEVGDVVVRIGPREFSQPSPVVAISWTRDELLATLDMYGGAVAMYLQTHIPVDILHPVQELPVDDFEHTDDLTAGDGYFEHMRGKTL